ncbi:MAG: acylneuraminate cytidylyltransferase, partial [Spirochaetales bacterium]|nr:acylneuraminate cytidylyltransferase [Spirochaetales bacterium]
ARYREHVCPYLYEHPELFTVARVPCPPDYRLPDASVTVDTASDYDRAVAIVAAFGPVPADADVFSWLRASVASGASA